MKPYLLHPSRQNRSKLIFGTSQLSPVLGDITARTRPEKEAESILTIQCLDHIGVGIQEHTPGFHVIPKNCVIAQGIIVPECNGST